jgi:hypothetical protein
MYGPQSEKVERLIAMCEELTLPQIQTIADASRRRGMNRGAWEAWQAAHQTSSEREKQAGNASWNAEVAIQFRGFDLDPTLMQALARAVNDAGLALSTEDLIGTNGYGPWDYDKLMSAWRAGAGDPA